MLNVKFKTVQGKQFELEFDEETKVRLPAWRPADVLQISVCRQ